LTLLSHFKRLKQIAE